MKMFGVMELDQGMHGAIGMGEYPDHADASAEQVSRSERGGGPRVGGDAGYRSGLGDMSPADLSQSLNAPLFAREKLGLPPDPIQRKILKLAANRVLLNCTRQWGKSTIAAVKAVHRAYFEPGSLTVVLSPSARQSGEFLRKAAGMARRLGVRPRGDGDNEISLLFPNESRIVGLPGTECTVRGFSAVSLMLIDEAARVPEELYNAVTPMLAIGNGDLWLMSTPFGRRGFFWEAWAHGGTRWERVSVPATECPRISREFLEEERARMGERWFKQEYLCDFVDVNDGVFDRELVEAALSKTLKPLVI